METDRWERRHSLTLETARPPKLTRGLTKRSRLQSVAFRIGNDRFDGSVLDSAPETRERVPQASDRALDG
jgi:hypothetical protein